MCYFNHLCNDDYCKMFLRIFNLWLVIHLHFFLVTIHPDAVYHDLSVPISLCCLPEDYFWSPWYFVTQMPYCCFHIDWKTVVISISMMICLKNYSERDCTGNAFMSFNSASFIFSTFVSRKGEKKQRQDVFVEEQEYWIKLVYSLKDCQWDTITAKQLTAEITFTLLLCYQIYILINNTDP